MNRTALVLVLAVVLLLAALEAWLDPGHHGVPGATALFAVAASAVLVGAATLPRLLGLQRPDTADD